MSNDIPGKITVGDFPEPQVLNIREALDIHALEWLLKKADLYKFPNKQQATNFMHACIEKTYESLGVKMPRHLSGVPALEYLLANGVLIKHPPLPLKTDFWRMGWYIYRLRIAPPGNEGSDPERKWDLAYFISDVLRYEGKVEAGGKIVIKGMPEYHVRTNVKM